MRLTEDFGEHEAMWYETLVDASIFRDWTLNVGRRSATARTAHMLCESALRMEVAGLGEQCAYEMPTTQEQLADARALGSFDKAVRRKGH